MPGLTGLWQVSGKNRTTFIEMMRLDIKYARSKTVWQDLEILCRTIPALIIQLLETKRARIRAANPFVWMRSRRSLDCAILFFARAAICGNCACGTDAGM